MDPIVMTKAPDLPTRFPEAIRLVIWDLDDTFWDGTLTEGGLRWRDDHMTLVKTLAERGIVSAICSKNDLSVIRETLEARDAWDWFIFPSIDWTPKGPRIKAMLEAIGLRAASCLFLDDNPMNLAQAASANPGLNVAGPEAISALADHLDLSGKDDSALSRLKQYKVKEAKAEAATVVGGDPIDFLRQSNVRVYLEYDVEAHLPRAIELINRTNQLNFTKLRLPEDPDEAAEQLRQRLGHNTTDAALVRVVDDFGDYGFVGFYVTRRVNNTRVLEHFCFSCRTLNMYIEHWVYAFLRRPTLRVVGEVLSDVQDSAVNVDWITPATIDALNAPTAQVRQWPQIFARGGCDLASLMHYFALHSDHVVEEFNEPRDGQMFRRDHSAFLMPALTGGLSEAERAAAASLGYAPNYFDTGLNDVSPGALVLLSFWADADIPLYRHRETGLLVPYWLLGAQGHDLIGKRELAEQVAKTDLHRERLATLAQDFEHVGILDTGDMLKRYSLVLDALSNGAQPILVKAAVRGPRHFRTWARPHPSHKRLNKVIDQLQAQYPNILVVDPAAYITCAEDMLDLNHFRREVYHRIYTDVISRL